MRKRKKNPVDDTYFRHLMSTIIDANPRQFALALIYYKIGFECKDCDENYIFCDCEECYDCKQNLCICTYDIWDINHTIEPDQLRKEGWKLARKTLFDDLLLQLVENCYHNIRTYKGSFFISKFIKIYENWYNEKSNDKEKLFKAINRI